MRENTVHVYAFHYCIYKGLTSNNTYIYVIFVNLNFFHFYFWTTLIFP